MWHLEPVDDDVLKDYAEDVSKSIETKIGNSQLPKKIQNLLIENLFGLLTFKPDELYKLHLELMGKIILGYDERELPIYSNAKKKKEENRSEDEKKAYKKYGTIEGLSKIFDYDSIISQNKSKSYWITKKKGAHVCTYCNRQYVFTVEVELKKGERMNDERRIARPVLDHWFPKTHYPIMALSFYNLIPCCPTCNSSAKGSTMFGLNTHIHPYLSKRGNPEFKFDYMPNENGKWKLDIVNLKGKEKDTFQSLHLGEIYHCHDDYEVTDFLKLATKNNGTYIDDLLNHVMKDFKSIDRKEIFRLILGTEYDEEKQDDRPLSKMKRDLFDAVKEKMGY